MGVHVGDIQSCVDFITGGGAPGGSGVGIPLGRDTTGAVPAVTPALAEDIAFLDWFGHPDNNDFDGTSLSDVPANLNNCDPANTMTTLISLEPMAPLAFLGLFP